MRHVAIRLGPLPYFGETIMHRYDYVYHTDPRDYCPQGHVIEYDQYGLASCLCHEVLECTTCGDVRDPCKCEEGDA